MCALKRTTFLSCTPPDACAVYNLPICGAPLLFFQPRPPPFVRAPLLLHPHPHILSPHPRCPGKLMRSRSIAPPASTRRSPTAMWRAMMKMLSSTVPMVLLTATLPPFVMSPTVFPSLLSSSSFASLLSGKSPRSNHLYKRPSHQYPLDGVTTARPTSTTTTFALPFPEAPRLVLS